MVSSLAFRVIEVVHDPPKKRVSHDTFDAPSQVL